MDIQCNKLLYKKIKKHGFIRINDGRTQGLIKITRVKVCDRYDWTVNDTCEVDIEYYGTIDDCLCAMGPDREVKPDNPDGGYTYRRRWYSKISRNKCVRRRVSKEIRDRLKYFSVELPWSHLLTVKKVVWNTTDIPQCDF